VFLDALGFEWTYETEGFPLEDGTWYLPDFYLPERKYWLEIKGQEPDDEDLWKIFYFQAELNRQNKGKIFVLCGDIPFPYPKQANIIDGIVAMPRDAPLDCCWQQCRVCSLIAIEFLGEPFCRDCVHKAASVLESWIAGTLDMPEDFAALPNYINLEAFLKWVAM